MGLELQAASYNVAHTVYLNLIFDVYIMLKCAETCLAHKNTKIKLSKGGQKSLVSPNVPTFQAISSRRTTRPNDATATTDKRKIL